jgi:hypothetical protein
MPSGIPAVPAQVLRNIKAAQAARAPAQKAAK